MFTDYNGTYHWCQLSHPKTASREMAQIGNKGGNLTSHRDKDDYYGSCIVACSVLPSDLINYHYFDILCPLKNYFHQNNTNTKYTGVTCIYYYAHILMSLHFSLK